MAHLAPDRESEIAALQAALELARSQAARPFELRIALDLHELLGEDARSRSRASDARVRRRHYDHRSREGTSARDDATVTGRPARVADPRRRHGRPRGRVAPQRARLAGPSSSRSPCTSGGGGSVARAPAAGARTAGSRSTACTSGWATTRTPFVSCASATPSSTGPRPIRRRRSGPGGTRCSPRGRSGSRIAGATVGTIGSASSRRTTSCRASRKARGREFSVADILRRALRLITDFLESLPEDRLPSEQMVLSGSSDAPSGPSAVGYRIARDRAGGRPRGLRADPGRARPQQRCRVGGVRWIGRSPRRTMRCGASSRTTRICGARGTSSR